MTEKIVVLCKGACGQEVAAAELDSTGVCALCQIMVQVAGHYEEYRRLWAKRRRYLVKGLPAASLEKQLGKVVGRIAAICHAKLPVSGAIKLVNEICERARAEVAGYDRILTVQQALKRGPKREAHGERRTASGIYIA